ncbi:replication restart helicase PriA [Buchnera aphidicola]|uniref:Probable replication restart protein PriA n=1 Tax=Buchnera aphidicola (Aphis aurantii) TaxID=1470492 RepID=A0AAU6W7S2_9GAMM
MIIVDVILPFPVWTHFSYIMPYSMIPIIGSRVIVPFRSKNVIGIIISICKKEKASDLNLKIVKSIIDHEPILNISLLNIFIWLSKYYYTPIGSLIFSIFPNVLKFKNIKFNKHNKIYFKHHFHNIYQFKMHKFFLSKKILLKINKILIKNSFSSWLISEINLYIKIKFYLGLFEKILKKNLQILIIVPFTKDIYPILFLLKKYFNIPIDIIHSNLSDKKLFDIWMKTKNNRNSIVIGTKKSIFFPFLYLGLIVIFEEHHLVYKNIDKFQYNVRDIAIFRAYQENIPIILDSNTPSLKTLYNVVCKKFFWINFHTNNTFLNIKYQIIDLKKEKIKIGLSNTLINKIIENIKKNFSVLLIFNKFDFMFIGLICSYCNWIPKCKICNDYYEVNKYNNIIFCRYCLTNYKKPLICYNCNFPALIKYNFGIKKIKKKIKTIFPDIPILFLISSNDIEKQKINLNISNFSIFHSGIIITMEKIAQNYYFPNIKLIGLINIDNYFSSFSFNNTEHFSHFYFNLVNLTKKYSKFLTILIQTSIPNNKDLINICNKKYFFCARNMLILRKKFLLPPWNFQTILYCQSKHCNQSYFFLKFIYIFLKKKSKEDNMLLWFVGPDPVFFGFKKKYFYKLLIQCSSRIYLRKILQTSLEVSKYFSIFQYVKWYLKLDVE